MTLILTLTLTLALAWPWPWPGLALAWPWLFWPWPGLSALAVWVGFHAFLVWMALFSMVGLVGSGVPRCLLDAAGCNLIIIKRIHVHHSIHLNIRTDVLPYNSVHSYAQYLIYKLMPPLGTCQTVTSMYRSFILLRYPVRATQHHPF
jgi:hypothetical protein